VLRRDIAKDEPISVDDVAWVERALAV